MNIITKNIATSCEVLNLPVSRILVGFNDILVLEELFMFSGVYLTDLVAIEEAHPDFLYNNLVNITKLNFIGSVLFVLEGCKKGKYEITPIPALQACLLATPSVSEEEQRSLSLAIEPLT